MPLPVFKRCCLLSIDAGCIILTIASLALCIASIAAGSWQLPDHQQRLNEDNLILMSMVMFSTLSAISNFLVLLGILRKRPGYLQLSIMSNSVFILCLFLVAVVACLFSPALCRFFETAANIVLVVFLIPAGVAYSIYHLLVVNSMYVKMKTSSYSDSALPV